MKIFVNIFGPEILLKQEISLDISCPTLRNVLKTLKDHPKGKWESFMKDDLSLQEGFVILVNGRNVSSLDELDTQIHDGDEITFTVLVAGGKILITQIRNQITVIKDKDPLTEKIIGCAYKVHSQLGPGFSEAIYHNALKIALEENQLRFQTEKTFNISFQGKHVGRLRLDLIVDNQVVIEVKALTGNIPTVFELQLLSYLKASGYQVGLLINFGNKSCQVRRLML